MKPLRGPQWNATQPKLARAVSDTWREIASVAPLGLFWQFSLDTERAINAIFDTIHDVAHCDPLPPYERGAGC